MFATLRHRPQLAAALVSLPLLAIIYTAFAGGSPAEAPPASIQLLDGVDFDPPWRTADSLPHH
jgi:hypothetical protein